MTEGRGMGQPWRVGKPQDELRQDAEGKPIVEMRDRVAEMVREYAAITYPSLGSLYIADEIIAFVRAECRHEFAEMLEERAAVLEESRMDYASRGFSDAAAATCERLDELRALAEELTRPRP